MSKGIVVEIEWGAIADFEKLWELVKNTSEEVCGEGADLLKELATPDMKVVVSAVKEVPASTVLAFMLEGIHWDVESEELRRKGFTLEWDEYPPNGELVWLLIRDIRCKTVRGFIIYGRIEDIEEEEGVVEE